jgi:hypothetical protein
VSETVDRQVIYAEYERVRRVFGDLVAQASPADLRRRSSGTRWTNEELLFHMLFGFLIVRALLGLVKVFGVLPRPVSRAYAAVLNLATGPFNVVNYLGSVIGAKLHRPPRVAARLDRVTTRLADRLGAEQDATLAKGMCLPRRWDPFFHGYLTLTEIYLYPVQHFDFHARQLSLGGD